MKKLSEPVLEKFPAVFFQLSAGHFEFLNRELEQYPGLTPAKLQEIRQGGWRELVSEEFHPEVRKLAALSESESYTAAEFPVHWSGNTRWLRILAAAVEEEGERKIVGVAQEVSPPQRLCSNEDRKPAEAPLEERAAGDGSLRELRHNINGLLTTIIVNCDLLLEGDCDPGMRRKLETILSEALRIDRFLRNYRRG